MGSEKVKPMTTEKWRGRYAERLPRYREFEKRMKKVIKELLRRNDIEFAQIEARTKSMESFLEKVQRKGKDYDNPLEQITDLVGIRIIAYYKEDIDRIGRILKDEFEIDWEHSVDKAKTIDPDRFGYLSVHYTVSLSSPRKELTEWKDFADTKVEIQVRTVLQHAWAAIDHKLRYKTTKEAPKTLRRKLSRLSALFEIADDEFSELRKLSERIEAHYSRKVETGMLNIGVDRSSLLVYFSTTRRLIDWVRTAEKVGFEAVFRSEEDLDLYDQRSRLARILYCTGVKTLQELDEILIGASEWGIDVLARICKMSTEASFTPHAHPLDVIIMLVLYDRRQLLGPKDVRDEILEATEFNTAILTAIREVIKDIAPPWIVSTDTSSENDS